MNERKPNPDWVSAPYYQESFELNKETGEMEHFIITGDPDNPTKTLVAKPDAPLP